MRLTTKIHLVLCWFGIGFIPWANAVTFNGVPDKPVAMAQLVPQQRAIPAVALQGHLQFTPIPAQARLSRVGNARLLEQPNKILPTIAFDFVQDKQGHIIPSQRSLTLTNNPYWDYFVGVGRIWQSREKSSAYTVALPFALVEKNENCVHNGILTFSLDNNAHPSHYYYQISSETCGYFKADFWGLGNTTLQPKTIETAQADITRYQQEQRNRLPSQPIENLTRLAPGISIKKLGLTGVIHKTDMTLYGMVFNHINYVSDCATRAGNYPFCQQLVLPSYSTAKSIFAGLTMLYLQQRWGDVFQQPVSKWVPQCQTKQWQGVTFANLLDMSTGNYHSRTYGVDEGADDTLQFFNATDHADRVHFACRHYAHKSPPGKQFVYHTSDTYLLGTALTAYIRSKLGKQADLFNDILLKHIFIPLKLSPITHKSRRTADNTRQPYTGYGLFFNRDDLARLSLFINGQYNTSGQPPVLAQQPLAEALQRTNTVTGLTTDYPQIRYWHSFWARNITSPGQCKQPSWLPFMSGYGGITLALLPASNSYYYVSDSYQYNWSSAVPEMAKLQSLCNSAGAAHPPAVQ